MFRGRPILAQNEAAPSASLRHVGAFRRAVESAGRPILARKRVQCPLGTLTRPYYRADRPPARGLRKDRARRSSRTPWACTQSWTGKSPAPMNWFEEQPSSGPMNQCQGRYSVRPVRHVTVTPWDHFEWQPPHIRAAYVSGLVPVATILNTREPESSAGTNTAPQTLHGSLRFNGTCLIESVGLFMVGFVRPVSLTRCLRSCQGLWLPGRRSDCARRAVHRCRYATFPAPDAAGPSLGISRVHSGIPPVGDANLRSPAR